MQISTLPDDQVLNQKQKLDLKIHIDELRQSKTPCELMPPEDDLRSVSNQQIRNGNLDPAVNEDLIMKKIYCLDSTDRNTKVYRSNVGTVSHQKLIYQCVAKTGHKNTDVTLEVVTLTG